MARFVISGASEILVGPFPTPLLPGRAGREVAAVLHQESVTAVAHDVAARLEREGLRVELGQLGDREAAKELSSVAEAWEWLAAVDVGRDDTVVAVGGGALTDAAGFVAATWMRGIEAVLVPTTLLGALDAAIGGKTGINVAGKNLVGAFAHPSRVLVDPATFASLDPGVLREGLAEALKAGYLADERLVELLRSQRADADLAEVVERAIAVKVAIVEEDFTERGRRAVLNYGHTIGHAIEYASGLSHGEAVGVGMVAAAAIAARRLGFDATGEHRETLAALGLPTTVAGLQPREVLDLVRLDKKRSATGTRMVLLRGYGDPVVETVDEGDLRAGLAAVGVT